MVTSDFVVDDMSGKSKDAELCKVLFCCSHSIAAPYERIAKLLEKGANPNARHEIDNRPVFNIAAFGGHSDAMSQLIEARADITCTDNKGKNCLHEAASTSKPDAIALILSQPQSQALINQKNCEGYTPLVSALTHCTREPEEDEAKRICLTIEKLLAAGADATLTDENGYTALMNCADCNLPDVLAMLIPHSNVCGGRIASGESALSIAINHLRTENVKLLLEAGADPNQSGCYGITLSHCAIFGRNQEDHLAEKLSILSLLSQWGGDIDKPDNEGRTPLAYALKESYQHEIVNALLDLGAVIPQTFQNHWAARKRFTQAHNRFQATIGANPPDVSSLTATDLIGFSNIGKLYDALRPDLWHAHRPQLDAMLLELPPYLADHVATMPILAPSANIGGWNYQGTATASPAATITRTG